MSNIRRVAVSKALFERLKKFELETSLSKNDIIRMSQIQIMNIAWPQENSNKNPIPPPLLMKLRRIFLFNSPDKKDYSCNIHINTPTGRVKEFYDELTRLGVTTKNYSDTVKRTLIHFLNSIEE